jgi:hypothetical protein
MEAIHTSTHDDSSSTAKKTSDKISGKIWNETRQARTLTWAPDTSPKRVNPEVTEEVMHYAGL